MLDFFNYFDLCLQLLLSKSMKSEGNIPQKFFYWN